LNIAYCQSGIPARVIDATPALEGRDVQIKHIDLAITIQVAHPLISRDWYRTRLGHISIHKSLIG
jgi:hypothetical protein